MFSVLQKHILNKVNLSEEEFKVAASFFIPKKIRKRQFLLQEGDICKYLAFVSKGCMKSYIVDDKGEEHVIQFAVEEWWISDLESFKNNQPSKNNIDAIEDSSLLLIDRLSMDKLFIVLPQIEQYFRILLENNNISAMKRITDLISVPAEERYYKFLETYPNIVQRIPQSLIASYLGITPQSLSRIRKELSGKK